VALSKAEAAEALGCSVDCLEERVLPELRVVRRGRRVFTVIAELQRWLDANGARVLDVRFAQWHLTAMAAAGRRILPPPWAALLATRSSRSRMRAYHARRGLAHARAREGACYESLGFPS